MSMKRVISSPYTAASYHRALQDAVSDAFASSNKGPETAMHQHWFRQGFWRGTTDCLEKQDERLYRNRPSIDGIPMTILQEGAELLRRLQSACDAVGTHDPKVLNVLIGQHEAAALELIREMVESAQIAPTGMREELEQVSLALSEPTEQTKA